MTGFINKLLYLLKIRRKELIKRPLNQDEEALARQVFQDQLPYGKIHIANFFLPDGEPAFVNAVLDKLGPRLRAPEVAL